PARRRDRPAHGDQRERAEPARARALPRVSAESLRVGAQLTLPFDWRPGAVRRGAALVAVLKSAPSLRSMCGSKRLRGGAGRQLVGLITRRSQVRILPPLPTRYPERRPRAAPFLFVVRHAANVAAAASAPAVERCETSLSGPSSGMEC